MCANPKEIKFHKSKKHRELIPFRDMMFQLKAEQWLEMRGRGRMGEGVCQERDNTNPGLGKREHRPPDKWKMACVMLIRFGEWVRTGRLAWRLKKGPDPASLAQIFNRLVFCLRIGGSLWMVSGRDTEWLIYIFKSSDWLLLCAEGTEGGPGRWERTAGRTLQSIRQ